MPNIRTYEAPQGLDLRPSEIGVDAVAGAGRRIAGSYDEAAAAVSTVGNQTARNIKSTIEDAGTVALQHIDSQQIAAGAAKGTEMFGALNQSKDDALKGIDPKDPLYGQKVAAAIQQWRDEKLEPSLEKFRDGFLTEGGQKWAEHFIDKTRQHMFTHSAADISTAAGVGVKNAVNSTVATASNTVMRDPSAVPSQLDLLDHSVTGLTESSSLDGATAAKVRSDVLEEGKRTIVHAGAVGAIQKAADPEAEAKKWSEQYPQYISSGEAGQLASAATVQKQVGQLASDQRRIAREQQQARALLDGADKLYQNTVQVDPATSRPIVSPDFFKGVLDLARQFSDSPTLATIGRTMVDWGKYQATQGASDTPTSPEALKGISDRVVNGGTTPIDIMRAQVDSGLSNADFAAMSKVSRDVAADTQSRPWANTIRQDVAAREPAALPEISTWLASAENATRASASKHVESVLAEYDATRNRQLTATMPLPQFIGVPREQITSKHVAVAQRHTLAAAQAGQLDLAGIARESTFLDRWNAAVKD